MLFAGVRGYLDNVDVGKVGAFERQMVSEMRSREPGIMDTIRADLDIKPETEKQLRSFLDGFSKSFAA